MKKEFIDKTVFFVGDSITQHGYYIYDIRSYFKGKKEKCYVFNRGIGGNTSSLAKEILGWELANENPDYVFISFGCNDMGVWLYDARKEETRELLEKRRQRDEAYIKGYEEIVDYVFDMGAKPVVMTPFAMSETFKEKEDIETLADNKEKEEYIDAGFYTHKTFANLNLHLAFYAEKLKELALKKGVQCFDLFSATKEVMWRKEELFNQDGVHYSRKGHSEIAKILLKFLGCQDIPETFENSELVEQIYGLEYVERSIMFLPANRFNPKHGKFTLKQMLEYSNELLSVDSTPDWLKRNAKNFLEKRDELPKMRREIRRLLYQL